MKIIHQYFEQVIKKSLEEYELEYLIQIASLSVTYLVGT